MCVCVYSTACGEKISTDEEDEQVQEEYLKEEELKLR